MITESLFVYGTLQDPAIQRALLSRTLPSTPDVLSDHAMGQITLSDGTYPMAIEAGGHTVSGVVLEVAAADLPTLDEYETAAYRRVKVTLDSGRQAWVYKK